MVIFKTYQSMFNYGETGDSLNGFRNSEISTQSAKYLLNFYISEMGTLKLAKQYEKYDIIPSLRKNEYIIYKLNTKYDFFIIFTQSRIITINKNTLSKISEINVNGTNDVLNEKSNINIFNERIFVKDKNNNCYVFGFNKNGELGTTNFLDTIKLPFQQKQDVSIDVYQCFTIDNKIRPELMTSYPKDVEIRIDGNGNIFLKNSGLKIDRFYEQYKSLISVDQINGATNGMVFAVFKNFQTTKENLGYYLDNTQIIFEGRTKDDKYGSYYYTKATPKSIEGKLIYGILDNFIKDKTQIIDIVEFQSRLVIATTDKMYFSKILDYDNFVPSLDSESGFYIKPSIIDGNQPNIKKLIPGNGLYVVCSEGIIVAGYGSSLNGINMSNVRIAGNSQPSSLVSLIEDIFYYVDNNGLLRAIVPDFNSGIIKFSNVIVEKYDYTKNDIKFISKGIINEDNSLIVTPKSTNTMRIYNTIPDGLFRRFSIEFNNIYPIFGHNNDIISGVSYYKLTNKNMTNAIFVLNVPYVDNSKGIYLNDFKSTYRRLALNVYSPDKSSIKGIKINDQDIQKLGDESKGDYSIYDNLKTIPIIDVKIDITSINDDNTIEVRGVNGIVVTPE